MSSSALATSPSAVEIVSSPKTEDDEVTVRISVTDDQNRPVVDLLDTDFQLIVDDSDLQFESRNWRRPQDVVPPPAWVIVLLDMSGSMNQPDSRGTTKLQGALESITQFKTSIYERLDTVSEANIPQIAIVPFGKPGENCEGFPVTQDELDKFFPADAVLLDNHLDFLAKQAPCAATNLYEPLSKAIRFLGNTQDPRFSHSEESQEPKPRLSVILLSDGYHTEGKEAEDFENLKLLIRQNPEIAIHTLGYGLTPEELGDKYGLRRPATRNDIGSEISADEFVDQARLAEISQLAGGISEFSADAATVAEKLQVFLNALLGEYEISYVQPNADRNSSHTVKVLINAEKGVIQSNLQKYRLTGFGRILERDVRLKIFACTLLVMGVAGVVPFWIWSNHLAEAEM
ncbi:vWA domain-containing protein [Sphaerothrix gracilis]|uniref:vWA domain-containing protein n=1 Tax=Sphaerothrix gracilis TaxID=3151835 RepID=UPI0031FD99E2